MSFTKSVREKNVPNGVQSIELRSNIDYVMSSFWLLVILTYQMIEKNVNKTKNN